MFRHCPISGLIKRSDNIFPSLSLLLHGGICEEISCMNAVCEREVNAVKV